MGGRRLNERTKGDRVYAFRHFVAQAVNDDSRDPPAEACDRAECVDCPPEPSDCGNSSLQAKVDADITSYDFINLSFSQAYHGKAAVDFATQAVLKFENKVRTVKLSASGIFILTDTITHLERENRKLFKWYTALCWDLKDVPVLTVRWRFRKKRSVP